MAPSGLAGSVALGVGFGRYGRVVYTSAWLLPCIAFTVRGVDAYWQW